MLSQEQITAWRKRTRIAQGLPPRITDPATLAAIACLVVEALALPALEATANNEGVAA